jgi:hypothetical protein
MTNKSEWQEANRRLMDEQRQKLGDPPTAEEMLAYSRGELPESEEERIRELLVAYPELARVYAAPFPEAPASGDADAVSDAAIAAGLNGLQRRLGSGVPNTARDRRADAQRGRVRFHFHIPTTVAAAIALVFFGLFVQAENRARHYQREGQVPRVLGPPQDLDPDGSRGPASATRLRKEGDAYLLRPRLLNQLRFPHYRIELRHGNRAIWTSHTAQADADGAFQVAIPHEFLREGQSYELHILGIDGDAPEPLGRYEVAVPAE